NCARVTTSAQSTLFGVPVALLGAAFFVAMLLVCLPVAWRDARLTRARVALAGLGVGFVIYLVYAELFLVDALCLWCTAVHLVALALFVVVVSVTAGVSTHTGRDALSARPRPR